MPTLREHIANIRLQQALLSRAVAELRAPRACPCMAGSVPETERSLGDVETDRGGQG
jgi:hypothetical protein